MPFFRRWVDRRCDSAKRAGEAEKVAEFVRRRDALINSLSYETRLRYSQLAQVCRDIESASADNPLASADPNVDPRLRKLDELMWTYLRLLSIQQSLQQFCTTERQEDVPTLQKEAEAEIKRLGAEIEGLKDKGDTGSYDSKQRYLNSRLERLDVLRKRQQRIEQADSNLQLVVSEQERLEQQIKLIRADAIATKNSSALTARIDATVEHLDQTNKWLSEMDEFKDLTGDMPPTEQRVGYEAPKIGAAPPPIPEPPRKREATRQKQ
jgi:DNA repair exonuclease SbcCD ATPase subunit